MDEYFVPVKIACRIKKDGYMLLKHNLEAVFLFLMLLLCSSNSACKYHQIKLGH